MHKSSFKTLKMMVKHMKSVGTSAQSFAAKNALIAPECIILSAYRTFNRSTQITGHATSVSTHPPQ